MHLQGDQHVVYDNRTGVRKRIENLELPNVNVSEAAVSPAMVIVSDQIPLQLVNYLH